MKIIDLLNKIANREEAPKKIHCFNKEFYLEGNTYFGDIFTLMHYIQEENLNDEVEILEEEKKIPEKLKWNEKSQHNVVTDNTKKTLEHLLSRSEQLKKSINEIVDYLDYLKSKGDE